MKLYVKKIDSLNPTRWSLITLNDAIEMYEDYIKAVINSEYFIKDKTFKTFNQYLKTEI